MTARERRAAADRRVAEAEFKAEIQKLKAKNRQLKRTVRELLDEIDVAYALFPPLLAGVAEALKGTALADWSDLPEVALATKRTLETLLTGVEKVIAEEDVPDFVAPPPTLPPEPDLPKCPRCGRLLGRWQSPNDCVCVCSDYPGAGAG